jgi:hypothetical protein
VPPLQKSLSWAPLAAIRFFMDSMGSDCVYIITILRPSLRKRAVANSSISRRSIEGWVAKPTDCPMLSSLNHSSRIFDFSFNPGVNRAHTGLKILPPKSGEILLEIIMRRYENRSTMMTSNRPIEEWGKLLSDVPAASAILDRLLHHAGDHSYQRSQLPPPTKN